jgi:hypothetical protein
MLMYLKIIHTQYSIRLVLKPESLPKIRSRSITQASAGALNRWIKLQSIFFWISVSGGLSDSWRILGFSLARTTLRADKGPIGPQTTWFYRIKTVLPQLRHSLEGHIIVCQKRRWRAKIDWVIHIEAWVSCLVGHDALTDPSQTRVAKTGLLSSRDVSSASL